MKKINLLFIIILLIPVAIYSQKYSVQGDNLYVSDTTYYNFKSVNYIGGELKSINETIENIKNTINDKPQIVQSSRDVLNKDALDKISDLETQISLLSQNSLDSSGDADSRFKMAAWLPWLGIVGLSVLGFLLFGHLKRLFSKEQKEIRNQIAEFKNIQEGSSLTHQSELLSYINNQLDLKKDLSQLSEEINVSKNDLQKPSEPDHSLALKLADEINRMEKNLSLMDAKVKGHRQLSRGVIRLKDNLMANGYEITDLLGKKYTEGMRISANFFVDENMTEGNRIITGIIKPQVLFNNKMIQSGQIEVTQN